jgi:hypothetical protein
MQATYVPREQISSNFDVNLMLFWWSGPPAISHNPGKVLILLQGVAIPVILRAWL